MDVCLLWVLCVVRERSLRRADHSSRGVLPTVMRRCVWSRNLKNEEAVARDGPQRHKKKKYLNLQQHADKCRVIPIFRTRTFPFTSLPIHCSIVISPSELLTALLINKYRPTWTPNYRTAHSCLNAPSSVLGSLCHILDRRYRQATLKCWRRL